MPPKGDSRIKRVEHRNSVLVISDADSKAPLHVDLTRRELADFVLGKGVPADGGGPLAQFNGVLDRSHLLPAAMRPPTVMAPTGKTTYTDGQEHSPRFVCAYVNEMLHRVALRSCGVMARG